VCGRDFSGAGKNRYFCLKRHTATVHAAVAAPPPAAEVAVPVCVGDEDYSSLSVIKTDDATYLCNFLYLLHTKHQNIVIPNVNRNEALIYTKEHGVKRTTIEDAAMTCIRSFMEHVGGREKIVLSEGFYKGFVRRLKNTHDKSRPAIVNNLRLLISSPPPA
jgi:hypothetical protein